jgi:nucleoid-associated protein YgaU
MARARRLYLPGSAAYDAERAKELRRQRREAKDALARARRSKAGGAAIRKAKERVARIEREHARVKTRQTFKAGLSDDRRKAFTRLGIATQNQFLSEANEFPDGHDAIMAFLIRYPDRIPPSVSCRTRSHRWARAAIQLGPSSIGHSVSENGEPNTSGARETSASGPSGGLLDDA